MPPHIIPRHYLKGFTDQKSRIWTYQNGQRPFCATLRKTSVESKFYPEETEKFLANQIEHYAAPVIEKIALRETISPDEKRWLARYMINLIIRVPHGKYRIKAMRPSVINRIFSEEGLRRMVGGREPSAKEAEEFWSLQPDYENEKRLSGDELWSKVISLDYFEKSQAALEDMTWQFLTFDAEPAFVTSDNPFFFFANMGIGNPLSEATLPISKHVVLWATWNADITCEFVPITKEIVVEINRRTVSKATRDIYSPVQAYWVAKLAERRPYKPVRIVTVDGTQHKLQSF